MVKVVVLKLTSKSVSVECGAPLYKLVMKNFQQFQKFSACSNRISRTPNRLDRDYFDEYEYHSLDETPFYRKLLTGFNRCLYFLSGPNFLVPFIGKCSNTWYSIPVV